MVDYPTLARVAFTQSVGGKTMTAAPTLNLLCEVGNRNQKHDEITQTVLITFEQIDNPKQNAF